MPKRIRDKYTNKPITVSLGAWTAQLMGNSGFSNMYGTTYQNLISFLNTQLLNQLQNAYPGVSRAITFNPTGLGLGTVFVDPNGGTLDQFNRQRYAGAVFIEPDAYGTSTSAGGDGSISHTFVARAIEDRSAADSDKGFAGLSYLDWGIFPPAGVMGFGGEAVVSQPIKADDRIYFEVHVDTPPVLQDSNGVSASVDVIGRYKPNRDGHASGGLQMTIAPENWLSPAQDVGAVGRAFSLELGSKLMFQGGAYTGGGSFPDLDTFTSSTGWTNMYKTNVSVEDESDTANLIQAGDVIMIAIDGVSDSAGENRLFWGVNGVWAQADSSDELFTTHGNPVYGAAILSHSQFNPAFDSAGQGTGAARPGISLVGSEDPYYLYFSPIWSDSSASYDGIQDWNKAYATQAGYAGKYSRLHFGVTVKTGTDVTYSPPTSGRGGTYRAH